MKVTIEKMVGGVMRQVDCGTLTACKDEHGNPRFQADRFDGQSHLFYAQGAAKYWLELGGILEGK